MASPSTPKDNLNPDPTSEKIPESIAHQQDKEPEKKFVFRDKQESSEDEVCSEKSDEMGNESSEDEFRSKESDNMRRQKSVIEYIIFCEQRLDLVESPHFMELMGVLNPNFVLPSKSMVVAEIAKIFEKEKRKLKNVLKLQRVSVSTSIWRSDPNAYTAYMSWISDPDAYYMCVNAHWIDDSWSSQKRTIGFIPIPDSEGDTVYEALVECFNDLGITQIHTITMDSVIFSNTTVDILNRKLKENGISPLEGGVLQLRCVCDIISSIVKDGLKELAPSIAKVENALMYAVSSTEANLEFKECVAAEQIESKPTLYLNDVTKWNTTYTMLDVALRYRKAFDRLKDYCSAEFEKLVDSDWENAKSSVQFLKPFYNLVTSLIIGSSAKSNFCFPYICDVKKELLILSQDANDHMISQLAVNTDAKLVEHWGDPEKINHVFFLAMVLDPRYKMSYLEHCLESMYNAEAVQKLLEKVKASLYKLFNEYTRNPNPTESTRLLSALANMHVAEGRSRNEVDHYLSEHCENILTEGFVVLAWWRDNGDKYKVLSMIAKDLLAVPMSSLSLDSVFCVGGRFLNLRRSELEPAMLNVMVCVKDWLSSYQNPDPRDMIIDDLDPILDERPDDDASVIAEEPTDTEED